MAKQIKKGLGRGLDSLLGDSFQESGSKPAPRTPARTLIDEEAAERAEVVERPAAAARPAEAPRVTVDAPEARMSAPAEPVAEAAAAPGVVHSEIKRDRPRPSISRNRRAHEEEQERAAAAADLREDEAFAEAEDHVHIKETVSRAADEVSIDSVFPNPDQPRTSFKDDEIAELARSIEANGLLQPVLVRPMGSGYQIVAGERRWQACKAAGLKMIPVRIKETPDDKVLELALIENIQRSDLNPIEEAYGYKRLMESKKLTQSELAQVVSKGRSTIANALRLLDLPEDAQQLLFEEKITAGHARAILSISTPEGRQKLTEKLIAEKLSVREAEALARLIEGREKLVTSGAKRVATPKSFKKAAKGLRDVLQAPVRVKTVQGKNKIEIEFKDEDELARIFEDIRFSAKARKKKIAADAEATPEN